MNNDNVATLAGGCFWCIEAVFEQVEGVDIIESGYTGGHTSNPSYEEVCAGITGHAEAVRLSFNAEVITYREILEIFFSIHDPTTLNRQGPDVGDSYRSEIFVHIAIFPYSVPSFTKGKVTGKTGKPNKIVFMPAIASSE